MGCQTLRRKNKAFGTPNYPFEPNLHVICPFWGKQPCTKLLHFCHNLLLYGKDQVLIPIREA